MRDIHRRTILIGGIVAILAVALNAGVVWAFWRLDGTTSTTVKAGRAVELAVTGTTAADAPLFPGGTTALSVTIENPNAFPIVIDTVAPGPERSVADEAHRKAGCRVTGVAVARRVNAVSWRVEGDSTATFTLPRGVTMTNRSDSACQGATFTIPLQVSGASAP
ncbi:hypothetical protein [Spirilliplanes yamanashiensis]|uniref:Uncharacterized protein n=1 Tax=Spirilliplanes yamanashiensis TaxID=42233 RepID=A0A8J4DGN6_9ACTN|nr:hypothetical protein [Spirilliplanes yamanashiensis]MDP9814046.1 hypothetical protein [Spirilliplanes yamanashiensis]GIJ00974.1 hypothetical protein Sya03_03260 [Spirilliplanes yamanashiensis]